MSMPQQLPQIAIFPARHPDWRKIILQQQTQNMLRILPVRLLFTPALASYLRRMWARTLVRIFLCPFAPGVIASKMLLVHYWRAHPSGNYTIVTGVII